MKIQGRSPRAGEMDLIPSCVVCGANDFELIYDQTLKKCRACTHVAANLRVDAKVLEKIYRENYFKGEEYVDYISDKNALQHNFSRRLDYLLKIAAFRRGQRAVEIGCAYGFFGEVLLRKFPFLKYSGFDVVPEACDYAAAKLGLEIKCADFVEFPRIEYCAHVFMWDVIEHLNNPQFYIEKVSQSLERKGKLYLTTADISALLPRLQKHRWRMIHPPSHLHYFSRSTLTLLLQKHGLKVTHVHYPSTARSLKQIYYSLFLLNAGPARARQFFYQWIPRSAFISLNTYDIMLMVAEKA